jgi:hypothetical protein
MLVVNDLFSSIEEARDAVNRNVLDEGESYRVHKSDCRRHIIIYKYAVCKFRIRASLLKKKGVVITILIPYSCSPASHYKNKQYSALCLFATVDSQYETPICLFYPAPALQNTHNSTRMVPTPLLSTPYVICTGQVVWLRVSL